MNKIFCLIAFCAAGFAFAGTPLSLKQALSEGLKGNLDIQKSELGSDGIDAGECGFSQIYAAVNGWRHGNTPLGKRTH